MSAATAPRLEVIHWSRAVHVHRGAQYEFSTLLRDKGEATVTAATTSTVISFRFARVASERKLSWQSFRLTMAI
jgi:hypothetical protein